MSEWPTMVVVLGAVIAVVLILLAIQNPFKPSPSTQAHITAEPKPEAERKTEQVSKPPEIPQTIPKSVGDEEFKKAEDDLRILSIEKEIVSYALTRLYEAQAEGKITEVDKNRLLGKYKDEMDTLEKQINNKQMVVRLHELEITQADLVKLFNEKFNEITRNIETIRVDLGLVPKSIPDKHEVAPPAPSKEKKAEEKEVPRPRAPPKTKAEERIEAIQQEVLKILERLDKQESEA